MLKLKRSESEGKYYGFNLKDGFYYGTDEQNRPVATSGWECNDSVAIYTLIEGKWNMGWFDIDETEFDIENIQEVEPVEIGFREWLDEFHDISWNDWDEIYSSSNDLIDEYYDFIYDGLPKFVWKQL